MNDLFITIFVIVIITCGIALVLALTTYFMILMVIAKFTKLNQDNAIDDITKSDLEDAERYIITQASSNMSINPTDVSAPSESHDDWL